MADSISKRVERIISGSINAIVSAVENKTPEMIMEKAIHEVNLAIDDVRNELGKIIASKYIANKRLSEKNTKHEGLSAQIEVAIKMGRDDLAEAAISHQLDIEAQIPILEHTIVGCCEKEKKLESFNSALQAKKREMKEELGNFRETLNSVSIQKTSNSPSNDTNRIIKKVDSATAAFENALEKSTNINTALNPRSQNHKKLFELEQLTHINRVKERLEAIKTYKDD